MLSVFLKQSDHIIVYLVSKSGLCKNLDVKTMKDLMKNVFDLHKQYCKKMSILIYHLVPPLIPHAAGIDDLSIEVKDISHQL